MFDAPPGHEEEDEEDLSDSQDDDGSDTEEIKNVRIDSCFFISEKVTFL